MCRYDKRFLGNVFDPLPGTTNNVYGARIVRIASSGVHHNGLNKKRL